jgi:hypothetical protein
MDNEEIKQRLGVESGREQSIDIVILEVKALLDECRLQLRQVNTEMASARAHYQQGHVHGGGKVGGFFRTWQRIGKDARLASYQPVKENLQRRKLRLEQQLSRLKVFKAQGTKYVQFD